MKFIRQTNAEATEAQKEVWVEWGMIGHMLGSRPQTLNEVVEALHAYLRQHPETVLSYNEIEGLSSVEIERMLGPYFNGAHYRVALALIRLTEVGLARIVL